MSKKKNSSWSAAATARWAREARIATVKFQRSTSAKEWDLGRLLHAYQVQRRVHGSDAAALTVMLGGMGYPPPYSTDIKAVNEQLVADENARLAAAPLYIMSPSMCDIVIAAAQTLTLEDLRLVDEADLPSPSGLLVLPAPLVTRTVGDELADLRALCWQSPRPIATPRSTFVDERDLIEGAGGNGKRAMVPLRWVPALVMSTYDDSHGPVQPDSFQQFAHVARLRGTPLPPLIRNATRCLPFREDGGRTIEDDRAALAQLREAAQRVTGNMNRIGERLGLASETDPDEVIVGEYVPGNEIDDADDLFAAKLLYAFWRLCEQQITEVEATEVNHSAQAAAARTATSSEARIVRLRHRSTLKAEDGRTVDWQHRWVVRMHKVRQWYPSEGRHKILMRGPYVKGPADKPLLGGETVQALVR